MAGHRPLAAHRRPDFRSPRMLALGLSTTEACERFADAGMKSLLTLALTDHILVAGPDAVWGQSAVRALCFAAMGPLSTVGQASVLYGICLALFYLSILAGGVLGDAVASRSNVIFAGGAMMIVGLTMLAGTRLAFPGLVLFAAGAGSLKGNLAAQVGQMFRSDSERHGGYAQYLAFLNAGVVGGPLVCGAAALALGWASGVLVAASGIGVGLTIYAGVCRGTGSLAPRTSPAPAGRESARTLPLLLVATVAIFLCFAAYMQLYNIVLVWARDRAVLRIGGWALPPAWLLSLDGAFTILLIPIAEWGFRLAARRGWVLGPLMRIATGCALCAAGYGLLAVCDAQDGAFRTGYLLGYLLLVDAAVVLVWPTGLSLISALAPPRLVGLLIGVFYLHGFFGSLCSGVIGAYYDRLALWRFWLMHAAIAASGAALLAVLAGPLSRHARGPQATTTSA